MRNHLMKKASSADSFDLSISDLMAALCCVFLLFLAISSIEMTKQKERYEIKNGRAGEYIMKQRELKEVLSAEFKEDFERWNAYITDDLTIHFRDINVLFEPNDDVVRQKLKVILDSLFPRLIDIISDDRFRDDILEIRIEGHTAPISYDSLNRLSISQEESFKRGMVTSHNRTTNVLFYCLENTKLTKDTIGDMDAHDWIRKHLVAISYSDSLPVYKAGTNEIDLESSRRVEIKIRTKAEDAIYEINDLE